MKVSIEYNPVGVEHEPVSMSQQRGNKLQEPAGFNVSQWGLMGVEQEPTSTNNVQCVMMCQSQSTKEMAGRVG